MSLSSHIALLCFILCSLLNLGAEDIDALRKEIRKPIRYIMHDGRVFEGRASDFSSSEFKLLSHIDGGSVEFHLNTKDIKHFDFPGMEARYTIEDLRSSPQSHKALKLYHALFEQQKPYFPYLNEHSISYFIGYVYEAKQANKHALSIGIAQAIKPYIKNKKWLLFLEDTILTAYYKLGIKEDALKLAQKWIQSVNRYNTSATGWWITAEMQYDAKDFKNALWTALRPITFSSQVPMSELDKCYVVAIASALKLKDYKQANILKDEMHSRFIKWPDEMPEFESLKTSKLFAPTPKPLDQSK